ncbi:MAG: ankyrin repeat domain-containing protein [Bacteroidia bacterium]|nr:ankyrin repeat domain-containing protein [Bacteroidia bacterium]
MLRVGFEKAVSLIIVVFFLVQLNLAQSMDKNAQALFKAVQSKEVSEVKKYLKKVSNPSDLRNESGATLLHVLFWSSNYIWGDKENQILNMLLDSGCDVNAKTEKYDATVLSAAIPHVEAMKVLVARGASVKEGTLLINAAFSKCLPCIEFLVENGVDVDQKNTYGETALVVAVKYNDPYKQSLPIVQYLVSKGANIHATSDKGETLMDLAIKNNNYEVKEYLKSLNIGTNYDHTKKPEKRCPTCEGSGWAGENREVWQTCSWCNGKGRIVRDRNHVGADMTIKTHTEYDCNNCKGKGKIFLRYENVKCRTCEGKGFIRQ